MSTIVQWCSGISFSNFQYHRVREVKRTGKKIVDVDGSYIYRKYHHHPGVVFPTPDPPLTGWETVSDTNYTEMASKLPKVTHGK